MERQGGSGTQIPSFICGLLGVFKLCIVSYAGRLRALYQRLVMVANHSNVLTFPATQQQKHSMKPKVHRTPTVSAVHGVPPREHPTSRGLLTLPAVWPHHEQLQHVPLTPRRSLAQMLLPSYFLFCFISSLLKVHISRSKENLLAKSIPITIIISIIVITSPPKEKKHYFLSRLFG